MQMMVRLAGIEPTTPWFVAKYSIQLSYSREGPKYTTRTVVLNNPRKERDAHGVLWALLLIKVLPRLIDLLTQCLAFFRRQT